MIKMDKCICMMFLEQKKKRVSRFSNSCTVEKLASLYLKYIINKEECQYIIEKNYV